jgi:hypothetical protein
MTTVRKRSRIFRNKKKSRRKTKNRKNKIQRGGGLTATQLHDFIDAVYIPLDLKVDIVYSNYSKKTDTQISKIKLQKIEPIEGKLKPFICLNPEKNILYNDVFKVYYNPENGHIVACHRGTGGSSVVNTFEDVGNNIRNAAGTTSQYLKTKRNLVAQWGHETLYQYLIEILNSENLTDENLKKLKGHIIKIPTQFQYIPEDYQSKTYSKYDHRVVTEYLEQKLTTIGHSQGAIYAYLYGGQGREIITFNPAPYNGVKPDETFDVKMSKDAVSLFSGKSILSKDQKSVSQKKTVIDSGNFSTLESHLIKPLEGRTDFFGNWFLYTRPSATDTVTTDSTANVSKEELTEEHTNSNIQQKPKLTKSFSSWFG